MGNAWAFESQTRQVIGANLAAFGRTQSDGADLMGAAVALVLVPNEAQEACFVITRRASSLKEHRGQWALPGGRIDEGENAEEAALRELHEEVNLALSPACILGKLDDYTTRSGYRITPVVIWAEGASDLVANPEEVAAVYKVPLHDVESPNSVELHPGADGDTTVLSKTIGTLNNTIYAPTGAFIHQMCEVCLHGRSTRVAHFDQPRFAWR
ncbi:MAG: CoA pyrophosphatase [Chromatiales bacterium]|jgi:8-oxo-dGTP pyrophosphatase MutT (NUDIX family)|nr:CoA pyrophosphatase [Chromatiales bacterium]